MQDTPLDLVGTPREALGPALARRGVPAHLAGRVFRAIHQGEDPSQDAQIGLPNATRLAEIAWRPPVTLHAAHDSPDGTVRMVVALHDGARVEAVLVPMARGRTTLCLSSQVGCAMACAFCATGTLGLTRHLLAGEIVGQVTLAKAQAAQRGRTVDRVVFMGMGEPLHNLDATIAAVRVLTDGSGPAIGGRRIVVSTVGLVDRLPRFAQAVGPKVGLALSLHAGTDETRRRIVPLARSVSLEALRRTILDTPALARRTWMAEYVLLPGVNDTPAEADGVAAFLAGLKAAVNLLPFNPFDGAGFDAPTEVQLDAFARLLRARGVYVTVRTPRGRAIDGACGQLALREARA